MINQLKPDVLIPTKITEEQRMMNEMMIIFLNVISTWMTKHKLKISKEAANDLIKDIIHIIMTTE